MSALQARLLEWHMSRALRTRIPSVSGMLVSRQSMIFCSSSCSPGVWNKSSWRHRSCIHTHLIIIIDAFEMKLLRVRTHSYLIAGSGEEVIDEDPNLLGDLQRLVLVVWSIHHQKVHLCLFLMTLNEFGVLHWHTGAQVLDYFPSYSLQFFWPFSLERRCSRTKERRHISCVHTAEVRGLKAGLSLGCDNFFRLSKPLLSHNFVSANKSWVTWDVQK